MRLATKSTWIRTAILFLIYTALPALLFGMTDAMQAWTFGKSIAFLLLLALFPAITICIAAWDGVKEGFTILWIITPVVSFLLPMFIFFNESALIYGAIYSIVGLTANGIASLFRAHHATVHANKNDSLAKPQSH